VWNSANSCKTVYFLLDLQLRWQSEVDSPVLLLPYYHITMHTDINRTEHNTTEQLTYVTNKIQQHSNTDCRVVYHGQKY
jgi:hypothetical protein